MKEKRNRIKVISILLVLVLAVTGCGSADTTAAETQTEAAESTEAAAGTETEKAGTETRQLTIFFSRMGNTDFPDEVDVVSSASLAMEDGTLKGNAELIAEWIWEETGTPRWEILTVEQYPEDYNDTTDVALQQQRDGARPKLREHISRMDVIDVIWLVIPNWWGDLPMPVYSFLEEYDLSGKTINVAVTHGGSGFSGILDTIQDLQPNAVIGKTIKIHHNDIEGAEEQVKTWARE